LGELLDLLPRFAGDARLGQCRDGFAPDKRIL